MTAAVPPLTTKQAPWRLSIFSISKTWMNKSHLNLYIHNRYTITKQWKLSSRKIFMTDMKSLFMTFRYYKWLRLQWESVEVSLVQVMHCRLFGTKPLPEPVEVPVIWNLMKANLSPCNNNAVITGITTRVVFIQIAKCADRRPAQWGMRDQNTCFVWNALTVVFILVFWSCSSQ